MPSNEPDDGGREVDGAQEVAGPLVVERGDRRVLLQPGGEALDRVMRLVEVLAVWRGSLRLALDGITAALLARASGRSTRSPAS